MKDSKYERVCTFDFEGFIRDRIAELRMKTDPYVSEHKMSIELGRSGSYMRNIAEGALPSLSAFFDILDYFNVTVDEFFAPLKDMNSPYNKTCERLRGLDEAELQKVNTFLDMIGK